MNSLPPSATGILSFWRVAYGFNNGPLACLLAGFLVFLSATSGQAQTDQTITFDTISTKTFGNAPFNPNATASSGLPVSYVSSNTAVATVSGNMVTIVGAGSSNITASQAGDATYKAAPSVVRSLTVDKASQSITFPKLSSRSVLDPAFALTATASSGLPVTYTSTVTSVASVSGNVVTINGAGSTIIRANQSGNTNYKAANPIAATLTITKAPQLIMMADPPSGKKYGGIPFTVAATANTGLPISYRSSDPNVATISGNTVTIVGAGQCTIIAEQAGNATYAYAAVGRRLAVDLADGLPLPPATLAFAYDGTPKGINRALLPCGSSAQIRYRAGNLADPAPVPELVFKNDDDTLELAYSSTGFEVTNTWAMAKLVSLAGTNRMLHSCEVTLATWSQYNNSTPYGYLAWANANPALVEPPPDVNNMTPGNSGGWYHPVTLTFYDYTDIAPQSWTCLAQKTVSAFIPWRPMKQADGTTYPYNSFAFRVPFTFPDGVILPDEVWVAVSFNTQTRGTAPVGAAGPYNALNVAKGKRPNNTLVPVGIGTDLLSTYMLYFQDWNWWSAPAADREGPMMRLRTIPTNATLTPPTAIGTYEVKTVPTGIGVSLPTTTSTMTIGKAPATVTLGNL
ncbi:MAG: hypothetical protein ACKO2G_08635, partial [Verrucomicrobiales bacterium]